MSLSESESFGVVRGAGSKERTDFLYRVSLKCLIRNEENKVLVVKEIDRNNWDLPGGGMDHSETIESALHREMKEEVNFEGDFKYRIIDIDEPVRLNNLSLWQLRLIFEVTPDNMNFSVGKDGKELTFIDPEELKNSNSRAERWISGYCKKLD